MYIHECDLLSEPNSASMQLRVARETLAIPNLYRKTYTYNLGIPKRLPIQATESTEARGLVTENIAQPTRAN